MKSDKNPFKLGMTASDVVWAIVKNQEDITAIALILHHVDINWRQKHAEPLDQISNYRTSLYQEDPIKINVVSRESVLSDLENEIAKMEKDYESDHTVVSVTSKVNLPYGEMKHIPMMNFHPEVEHDQLKSVIDFLREIGEKDGVVLESGRYFHYYGNCLMSEREWVRFSAIFLKPCVLVSPRYVGQILCNDYSTLRLTKDDIYKPTIPAVIHIL